MFKPGPDDSSFYLQHFQARQPTLYKAHSWLKLAREHPAIKQAHVLLAQSSKLVSWHTVDSRIIEAFMDADMQVIPSPP